MPQITKYILAFAVSLVSVGAAPMENAANREITVLRRSHEDGLNRLLNKYLKERNLAAVSAVCAEIKAIRSELPKVEMGKPPVGRWSWSGEYNVVISSNGLVTWNDSNYGIWKWLNESERRVEIRWDNGFTDTFTISPDGKRLHIVNNYNDRFTAEKVDLIN